MLYCNAFLNPSTTCIGYFVWFFVHDWRSLFPLYSTTRCFAGFSRSTRRLCHVLGGLDVCLFVPPSGLKVLKNIAGRSVEGEVGELFGEPGMMKGGNSHCTSAHFICYYDAWEEGEARACRRMGADGALDTYTALLHTFPLLVRGLMEMELGETWTKYEQHRVS